jgi:O-succinylbenzoate synthase
MLSMADKPWITRYRMRSRGLLNAATRRRDFEGALARVGEGFGCIHPWPELGDPPLERCLADLAGPRKWPIVRRALRCAAMDAMGRAAGVSLFEDLEVPESHATLTARTRESLEAAQAAGFSVVKLKAGINPEQERVFLDAMTAEFPSLRWRLDFNEVPEPDEAAAFLSGLDPHTRSAIDFVEDPCPYSESTWNDLRERTSVALAVDREAAPRTAAADVMVVKPAVDEPLLLAEAALARSQRIVVTSSMDHPLGQAFAALEAACLAARFPGAVGVCGLQTHHLFEPDPFIEAMGPWTPGFHAPLGTGLGFDDLLDTLPWTRHF